MERNSVDENWFRHTMVVCPHFDDESISLGGTIARLKSLDHTVSLLVMCEHRDPIEQYLEECLAAVKLLGVEEDELLYWSAFTDHRSMVYKLDRFLDSYNPSAVLIPYPSHHQDHQVLYDVCCSSLRQRPGLSPKFVGMYEYPYTDAWPNSVPDHRMIMNISDCMSQKVEAMYQYDYLSTAVPPHPLSIQNIINRAKIRGQEVGCEYGEAIYPVRCLI